MGGWGRARRGRPAAPDAYCWRELYERPRPAASGVGELLGYPAWGYRPSNGYNAPGPLPRSALAASGVRVSVGASRVGPRAGAAAGAPARRSQYGRCAPVF